MKLDDLVDVDGLLSVGIVVGLCMIVVAAGLIAGCCCPPADVPPEAGGAFEMEGKIYRSPEDNVMHFYPKATPWMDYTLREYSESFDKSIHANCSYSVRLTVKTLSGIKPKPGEPLYPLYLGVLEASDLKWLG